MKTIEVSKIIDPIPASDGAGVKLKRSIGVEPNYFCLLYTSPSPRDKRQSRMPSSA